MPFSQAFPFPVQHVFDQYRALLCALLLNATPTSACSCRDSPPLTVLFDIHTILAVYAAPA